MDNKMTWNRLATEIIADREKLIQQKNVIIILLSTVLLEALGFFIYLHKTKKREKQL